MGGFAKGDNIDPCRLGRCSGFDERSYERLARLGFAGRQDRAIAAPLSARTWGTIQQEHARRELIAPVGPDEIGGKFGIKLKVRP